MVNVVGNGISDACSNPRRSCLHFPFSNSVGEKHEHTYSPYSRVNNKVEWVF